MSSTLYRSYFVTPPPRRSAFKRCPSHYMADAHAARDVLRLRCMDARSGGGERDDEQKEKHSCRLAWFAWRAAYPTSGRQRPAFLLFQWYRTNWGEAVATGTY